LIAPVLALTRDWSDFIRTPERRSSLRLDLDQGGRLKIAIENSNMWQLIGSAPFDRDLELAVFDGQGEHALAFPCRRVYDGWISATSKQLVNVRPTHWREWVVKAKNLENRGPHP